MQDFAAICKRLHASFSSGKSRPLPWRKNQLFQLARMIQDNLDAWTDAILADLGRPLAETYPAETGLIIERSIISAQRLDQWAQPERVRDIVPDWQKSWNPTIYPHPKGTVLIIGPWNYPMVLTLQPLIGAIAAGCCALVKPSEFAPNYANLLTELMPRYLDPSAFCVVLGAVEETTAILELQWDHIFYTGNGRVGRIIATAAAKHLTPTTLELGGKSPIIIADDYDIDLAAKRLLWGKINNCGQICVCPDYALIPRSKQDDFVRAITRYYNQFFPNGALNSPDIGHIITDAHLARLKGLLARTKGAIVLGGKTEDSRRRMEPTVVKNVQPDDSLMEEELFGPILPLIPVDSVDDAIALVNSRPHPLMLYVFTDKPAIKSKVLESTQSGNIAFNDTFQALSVNELPFGGVGDSGYGRQILKYTFEAFTYPRASIDMPADAEPTLEVRYPPYTADKVQFLSASCHLKIPDNVPE